MSNPSIHSYTTAVTPFEGAASAHNLTINCPSSYSSGDLLVLVVLYAAVNKPSSDFTPPSGFTQYGSAFGNWGTSVVIYTKTATGSEPSTYTMDSSYFFTYVMWLGAISNCGGIDAVSTSSGSDATSQAAGSVTTTHANDLVLCFWCVDYKSSETWTLPGGVTACGTMTSGQAELTSSSYFDMSAAAAYFTQATAGATNGGSSLSASESSASYGGLGFQLALSPPSSTAYTLTGSYGGFTETGEAATLSHVRTLTSAYGSFAETGEAATFGIGFSAGYGSFVLTGEIANLPKDGLLTISTYQAATPATFTLSFTRNDNGDPAIPVSGYFTLAYGSDGGCNISVLANESSISGCGFTVDAADGTSWGGTEVFTATTLASMVSASASLSTLSDADGNQLDVSVSSFTDCLPMIVALHVEGSEGSYDLYNASGDDSGSYAWDLSAADLLSDMQTNFTGDDDYSFASAAIVSGSQELPDKTYHVTYDIGYDTILYGDDGTLSTDLGAGYGSFTFTGDAATLSHGYNLSAGYGVFVCTGEDDIENVSLVMHGNYGVFVLTGEDATFSIGYNLTAAYGAFVLTGYPESDVEGYIMQGGGIGGGPRYSTWAILTIPSGKVASDLYAFPLMVNIPQATTGAMFIQSGSILPSETINETTYVVKLPHISASDPTTARVNYE